MSKIAIARLEELLDFKDEEIEVLQGQLQLYRSAEDDKDWSWARHRAMEGSVLPVPRLQLTMLRDDSFTQEWDLALVLKTWNSKVNMIPITASRRGGGSLLGPMEKFSTAARSSIEEFSWVPGIFTDLVRTAQMMPSIPAVVVVGDHAWQWIDSGDHNRIVKDQMIKITGPIEPD